MTAALRGWQAWTARNQPFLWAAYLAAFGSAVSLDLYLVGTLQVPSISDRSWAAVAAHPMIGILEIVVAAAIAWTVRYAWPLVAITGFACGHLLGQL